MTYINENVPFVFYSFTVLIKLIISIFVYLRLSAGNFRIWCDAKSVGARLSLCMHLVFVYY